MIHHLLQLNIYRAHASRLRCGVWCRPDGGDGQAGPTDMSFH